MVFALFSIYDHFNAHIHTYITQNAYISYTAFNPCQQIFTKFVPNIELLLCYSIFLVRRSVAVFSVQNEECWLKSCLMCEQSISISTQQIPSKYKMSTQYTALMALTVVLGRMGCRGWFVEIIRSRGMCLAQLSSASEGFPMDNIQCTPCDWYPMLTQHRQLAHGHFGLFANDGDEHRIGP